MHTDVIFDLSSLAAGLLVLARVSGIIVMVPIPGLAAGPDASRIVLVLAITGSLFPLWPHPAFSDLWSGRMLGWALAEFAIGLTVGVAVAFLLEGIQLAAQIIGLQAGYSFVSTIDPTTQADS